MSECKPWARMRLHGPCLIYDWHATEEEARDLITASFQTVAYFPDRDVPVQGGEPK